jgi:formyl-CoA transferase
MYDLDLKQWLEEEILYPWLFTHTKQEIMEKAQSVGFAATALKNMEDLFEDPHFRSRDFFKTVEHPVAGTYEYAGPFMKPSATPGEIRRAPLLGEHNAAVLCGRLGYAPEDLVLLRDRGII